MSGVRVREWQHRNAPYMASYRDMYASKMRVDRLSRSLNQLKDDLNDSRNATKDPRAK